MFIVFEGIDGVGKTTQAGLLFSYLNMVYPHNTILFRSELLTDFGQEIKNLIYNHDIDALTELFLFLSARSDFISRRLKYAVDKAHWVILERFIYSTLAYQGFAKGLDIKLLQVINELITQEIKPDLVILLDAPVDVVLERLSTRDKFTKFEQKDLLERAREGYLKIAEMYKDKFVVIDATKSIEEVHKEILDKVKMLGYTY